MHHDYQTLSINRDEMSASGNHQYIYIFPSFSMTYSVLKCEETISKGTDHSIVVSSYSPVFSSTTQKKAALY